MTPPSIGSFVMSVVGEPSKSYPFAPTCWILIGVDAPIEFPSTFHRTYSPPPGASKPDASIAPPFARSQMSGSELGLKGPRGSDAVAMPMQWSLPGPPWRCAVSVGAHEREPTSTGLDTPRCTAEWRGSGGAHST